MTERRSLSHRRCTTVESIASPRTPDAITTILPAPEPELDFSIELVDEEQGAVLVLGGEIDMGCASDVAAAIEHVLARSLPVVVDLCDVRFIDSTGVSLVLRARSMAQMRSLGFAVCCAPSGPADRLFGLVGLADALALHATRSDALRALRAAA